MATETNSRSLAKSISYRLLSSIITGGIVFGVTREKWLAGAVALFDSLIKTLFYYLHERVWAAIPFGRLRHPLEEIRIRRSLTDSDKQVIRITLSELGVTEEQN